MRGLRLSFLTLFSPVNILMHSRAIPTQPGPRFVKLREEVVLCNVSQGGYAPALSAQP